MTATGNTTPTITAQQLASEAERLAAFGDVNALVGLIEAYIAAANSLNHAAHMPRTAETPAYELLQGEVARLDGLAEIAVTALAGMTSVNHQFDRRTRAEALVSWAFYIGDTAEQVMAIMASAMTISTTKPN